MPAPSGTVWGSIVGSYGRIGIHTSLSSTATTTSVNVEIWFWSKYSVSDNNNSLYFDNRLIAGNATTLVRTGGVYTTVVSGSGWDEANQVRMESYKYTYERSTSNVTRYLSAALMNVDRVGGTMYASSTFSIPSLTSYTVTYNANGGTGAPSNQTKWYSKGLTLSSTKPTRAGAEFLGWATSASGSVKYAPGAVYVTEASVTLYAVWKVNTYTVSYNANGGTGAPSSQTKTHGTPLTLSGVMPGKAGYSFLGWGTSANATTAQYSPYASYTANANITLYAVWELAYVKPIIHSFIVSRCDSSGTEKEDGNCGLIKFDWQCTNNVTAITIAWEATAGTGTKTVTASGKSGSVNEIIGDGALNNDISYTITVTVSDSGGSSNAKTTLSGLMFPIDALAGGKGVAFGKPAELEDVADFGFDAKFNKPVYGKALGMDRLPAIPENSDLNNYMEPGCYAIHSNAIAETITCGAFSLGTNSTPMPPARAGRLEVWSATGEGIRLEQWSYLRQRFIPYNSSNAVWEREITRSSDNVWRYYEWWKSSLTPAASEKVYSKAALTISVSSTTTLGVVSAYTKIPLNTFVVSTSSRLGMSENSIRIGANISYVKVSGQALIGCKLTDGLRHVKIRKVRNGTVSNVSWVTAYGIADRQTIYPLTPVIVSVAEGDLIDMVFYTGSSADQISAGSSTNGWQTYLTVEEL